MALLGLTMGTAQASPGTVFFQVTCSSQSYLSVRYYTPPNGFAYTYAQPACTNWGEGGYSTNLYNMEPVSFHTGPGWCTNWSRDDGPVKTVRGGTGGVWQNVHPGEYFSGWMKIAATSWDC